MSQMHCWYTSHRHPTIALGHLHLHWRILSEALCDELSYVPELCFGATLSWCAAAGGLLLGSAFYRERLEEQLDSCSLKPNLIMPKVSRASRACRRLE